MMSTQSWTSLKGLKRPHLSLQKRPLDSSQNYYKFKCCFEKKKQKKTSKCSEIEKDAIIGGGITAL